MMPTKRTVQIDKPLLESALAHIEGYFQQTRRQQTTDKGSLIGLPYPYIVPSINNQHFSFEEQYYWDSYFIARGLDIKTHETEITGMLDNLIFQFNRFGVIPNASRLYLTSRSQPPLLTSYINFVADTYNKPIEWQLDRMKIAEQEYLNVWRGTAQPHWREVYEGLSRYYDINMLHDLAEAESGWDMTPRFRRKCLDYLPIDLNSLLYKYEMDFATLYEKLGDHEKTNFWYHNANVRRETIDRLLWSKKRRFFFDYNYMSKKRSDVWSLAAYYPLWVGLVDDSRAKALVNKLKLFRHSGGLAATSRFTNPEIFGSIHAQWAYPNAWAPLHLIITEGLEKYGYHDLAADIGLSFLQASLIWFGKHHEFLEKYNALKPNKPPANGVYPTQTGFGWTNSIINIFANKYI
jgi:alpha,alpha-trehalase